MSSLPRDDEEVQRTVLITGCRGGGIGYTLAEHFAGKGLRVFATVRSLEEPRPDLNFSNITWLPLDVTDQGSIDKCVELFKDWNPSEKLDILVNNAGVGYSTPLLDIDMTQARKVFEVNYFGVLAVTKAFSPLLLESKGVVANISSVAQFAPVPFMGVYNSSKAALGMLSETLRLELKPFGVKVVNVVTGGVVSNMNNNNTTGYITEESFYHPGKEVIDRVIAGELALKHQSNRGVYAAKVVEHLLSKRPKAQFFAGDRSTTLRVLDKFGWHTIWDMIFPRMSGLKGLKPSIEWTMKKREEAKIRKEIEERQIAAEGARRRGSWTTEDSE